MTDIYLAGAENNQHQALLMACGATKVAVNVGSLMRRPGFSTWLLDLLVPEWSWIAYADGPVSHTDLQMVMNRVPIPPTYVIGSDLWADEPNFVPLWAGEKTMPDSTSLFVTNNVFSSQTKVRRVLATRSPGRLLGAITGSSETGIGRFDVIISAAWYCSLAYGETQIWDGKKLNRYNASKKMEVRTRHLTNIANLGLNPDLVMLEDRDEVAKLAIHSWRKLDASLNGEVAQPENLVVSTNGTAPQPVAIAPATTRHKMDLLPGLGADRIISSYRDGKGQEVIEETPVIRSSGDPIRTCNNCHLATSGCPGYVPNAKCAYEIPVQIRTKEQLQALMEAVIEIQTQRVLQARFTEEIQGQELQPTTGREIDTLFKTIERMKNILDQRESFKVTVDAKAGGGMISRLFGSNVGTNARQLPEPVDPNQVLDGVIVE